MLSSDEIIRTVEMLKNENLDVRTVTLGISLRDCVSASAEDLCARIRPKIQEHAKDLVPDCDRISQEIRDPHREQTSGGDPHGCGGRELGPRGVSAAWPRPSTGRRKK